MKSVLLNTTVIGSSVKLPRHPKLIIGDEGNYLHGDILDANATTQQINRAIESLIAGAPEVLDTLKEISTALGDDENLAATLTNLIAALNTKVDNNSLNQTNALNAATEALSARITILEDASSWNNV